jgi:hypothetical protein
MRTAAFSLAGGSAAAERQRDRETEKIEKV